MWFSRMFENRGNIANRLDTVDQQLQDQLQWKTQPNSLTISCEEDVRNVGRS